MFVKAIKNNAYFKRYQVKFRRRREGKTDYYQRKRLITQRKNKYNTPKYRFVVRRTNQKVICQIVSSTITGDYIKAQALSTELKKYGLTSGLTNYASFYATGLLCARRLLTKLDEENKNLEGWKSIAKEYDIVKETTGEYLDVKKYSEEKDLRRPFTAYLDLGLNRSTKGARVFAALKGAVDGGINIPHKDKIFPQSKDPKKGDNPLKERLYGGHVQKYLTLLKKGTEEYKRQFSKWDETLTKAGVKTVEDLYKKVFAEIRKDPSKKKAAKKEQKKVQRDPKDPNITINGKHKYRRDRRLNNAQRKARVQDKINKFIEDRKKAATKKK
jgi:large subunit ribosomal protein L5e